MATATFDTHRFIRKLRDAGINEQQAEAVAEAIKETQESSDLLTKKDLLIALAELKADPMKWVIGLALAQVGLLVGILMRLPH
jgi:hypothetical protein